MKYYILVIMTRWVGVKLQDQLLQSSPSLLLDGPCKYCNFKIQISFDIWYSSSSSSSWIIEYYSVNVTIIMNEIISEPLFIFKSPPTFIGWQRYEDSWYPWLSLVSYLSGALQCLVYRYVTEHTQHHTLTFCLVNVYVPAWTSGLQI